MKQWGGPAAVACLLLTFLTAFRSQARIGEYFDAPQYILSLEEPEEAVDSSTNWKDLELVPPPPPVVSNTSFWTSDRTTFLTPLRPIDRETYTLRILSWNRSSFLAASVALHSQCPGVQQIQVVWSVLQEPHSTLPQEVLDNPKVVVERRSTNRLNNRFDLLPSTPTTTLGVVIIDDDLIYNCSALDMGFFLWAQEPHRMVTFAPRKHAIQNRTATPHPTWRYAWYRNYEYSLGLTSTAFLHRDYLHYYTHYLPRPHYQHIQSHMNCEDIAMSLFISNLTKGEMPLAVDEWGIKGRLQLALPSGYQGIKNSQTNHMLHRSNCVDWFATDLNLKEKWVDQGYQRFQPISVLNESSICQPILENPRFQALQAQRREWAQLEGRQFGKVVRRMRQSLKDYAKSRNLSSDSHG